MAPLLLDASGILRRSFPDLQFVMPLASGFFPRNLENRDGVAVLQGMVPEALHASVLALVTSGTATLEAALEGTPMIIVYKLSPLSYWMARALVSVKNIGLVNLVAGRSVVPELIQGEATPERIASEAARLLGNEARYGAMKADLASVASSLTDPSHDAGASHRVARIILSMI